MRWALAWSFYDDVVVPSPPSKKCKLEKARKPLSFTLPEPGLKELQAKASALGCTGRSPVDSITALVEKTLTDLRVLHKRVPCKKQEQSLFLTAVENTWIHGRQNKREQKRQLRELPRAPHCAGTASQTTITTGAPGTPPTSQNQPTSAPNISSQNENTESKSKPPHESGKEVSESTIGEQKEVLENVTGQDVDMESSTCTETEEEANPTETPAAASEPPSKRPASPGAVKHFLFKCLLNVIQDQSDVVIEMHWVEGLNRDLMNQLCTYLKNTLLKSVAKC